MKTDYNSITDCGISYEDTEPADGNLLIGETACEKCSAEDALMKSMSNHGKIILDYMESVSGLSKKELIDELAGKAMWQDPVLYGAHQSEGEDWLIREQYVKGNIFRLLREATDAQKRYGRFAANIKLLKASLPESVDISEIFVSLGATWVPSYVYHHFLCDLFGVEDGVQVTYCNVLAKWKILSKILKNDIKNNFTYGTVRMSAIQIIEHTMNAKAIKICDTDMVTKKSVFNRRETLAVQEKQKLILRKFQDWLQAHKEVLDKLSEIYSEKYGYIVGQYNGNFLKFPGMNPEVQLYEHQKNAIARIILTKNVLLAHNVGAGKTYEMIVGAHELKRMGLSDKNLIVMPKNVVEGSAVMHRNLYPEDQILVIRPEKEFSMKHREETINKIKFGDYTAIYMAHSSFNMLTMSKEYYCVKMRKELRKYQTAMSEARTPGEKKEIESEIKKISKKYKEFFENTWFDEMACFDDLGITALFVDESHNYKNITLDMRLDNVVGMHYKGSKKSDSMLEKVRYTQMTEGRVIFATGTPLTNSMADLYVLQKYLQPDDLEFCGISHFSEWINLFGERETSVEIDIDSQTFRMSTRFSRFHNLPELMSMFSTVCDFCQCDVNQELLPEFHGYEEIIVPRSDEQAEYMQECLERKEGIRNRELTIQEDNMLKLMVEIRKCALDIRLVKPECNKVNRDNKVKTCAKKLKENYDKYPNTTQLVFCDMSISTPDRPFSVYDDLKDQLQKLGIKEGEIAFIHDAKTISQRNKLLDDFNEARVRIMISTTAKLAEGVNLQKRMKCVHHLDIPWKPSDMVQREGRLIRPYNENEEVFIYRYITEGTFDSYAWQILENKQKFISSFLSGSMNVTHRSEEDILFMELNYAMAKAIATGNPILKKRMELENELERLKLTQRQRRQQLLQLQQIMVETPGLMRKKKQLIKTLEIDAKHYKKHKKTMSMEERDAFGKELLSALSGNVEQPKERLFDWYQEFKVILPANMSEERPYVLLSREGSNSYYIKMDGNSPIGCSRRLDYVLEHLSERREKQEEEYWNLVKQLNSAKEEYEKGDPFDVMVDETKFKLDQIDAELQAS